MSKTIVFFGSGPVAAASLDLLAQDFAIEAVITKPRPAHHRGPLPVVDIAEKHQLPVLYAADRAALDTLFADSPVQSQLAVLIDFGILISPHIIDYFPLGILNSHFSVLPQWRGADPITHAITSGQTQTGVSIMLVAEGMDTGNLLGYGEYDLPADITEPALTSDLVKLSHALLQHHIPSQFAQPSTGAPQENTGRTLSHSRKLTKQDGILDWQKPAVQLEREIRAYITWPRSRATIGDTPVVIAKAHVVAGTGPAGTLWKHDKQFGFYTADGILVIDELVPAGKKRMPAAAFLAGYQLP